MGLFHQISLRADVYLSPINNPEPVNVNPEPLQNVKSPGLESVEAPKKGNIAVTETEKVSQEKKTTISPELIIGDSLDQGEVESPLDQGELDLYNYVVPDPENMIPYEEITAVPKRRTTCPICGVQIRLKLDFKRHYMRHGWRPKKEEE